MGVEKPYLKTARYYVSHVIEPNLASKQMNKTKDHKPITKAQFDKFLSNLIKNSKPTPNTNRDPSVKELNQKYRYDRKTGKVDISWLALNLCQIIHNSPLLNVA